jgi:hypothetical protein
VREKGILRLKTHFNRKNVKAKIAAASNINKPSYLMHSMILFGLIQTMQFFFIIH